MPYAIMKIKKIKSCAEFTKVMEHNYRLTPVLNADPNLQYKNEELINLEYKSYNDAYKDAISKSKYYKTHKVRKNAVRGLEVLMTYKENESDGINLETWKRKNLEWMMETFGKSNVKAMTYHGDESSPHIHAIVIPMINDRLNAYQILGNRHKMRELQDGYAKVMEPLGLERGLRNTVAKSTDIQKFYAALKNAINKKLPDIIKGETIEQYKVRADAVYENANLNYYNEKLKAERQLVEVKTKHKNEMINISKENSNLKRKLKSYEGFEHELGQLCDIKEEIIEYRILKSGLENLKQTSPEEANRVKTVTDYMESAIKWEKKRKKNKELEKEQLIREKKE